MAALTKDELARTGIEGLDYVLEGGLPRNRMYLIQGDPGVGKTTLGLQFLLEGARKGEKGVYIALSETADELHAVARSHGWSLDGVHVQEIVELLPEEENTLFHASEVELGEATRRLLEAVRRFEPTRVVFDSLSEIRLMAQGGLRYRRQILALKQFFTGRNCTVLLLEDATTTENELQSLVHGVISLEQLAPVYGAERRRLRVIKLRGVKYRGGNHDYRIATGGLAVFPRLVAAEHRVDFQRDAVKCGLAGLDEMLGGGIEPGTSVLFMGPPGSGKSALAMHYLAAAARRDATATYYTFDEGLGTLVERSEKLGAPVRDLVAAGRLRLHQVDPAELTPGEFASSVVDSVERHGSRVIAIDSLNGYLTAMPEEKFLTVHLHELFSTLRQRGVLTIATLAQQGFIGAMSTPIEVSYLADALLLFRYYEAQGEVRRAISVVKKRSGLHQSAIRDFALGSGGFRIGEPLYAFRGVMTGVPVLVEPPGRPSKAE